MKIVILQYRLFHYRVELFALMRKEAIRRGWQFEVVAGQPYRQEMLKKDVGQLDWVVNVKNLYFPIVEKKDLCWQPVPHHLRDADLLVFMQENRLISNYWWILRRRFFGGPRVAFWGHGRDFQTRAPGGLREYWKSRTINWADWWFAYTQLTVEVLRGHGFPGERITCLNNAIDVNGLVGAWKCADTELVARTRRRYGIDEGSLVGIFCGSLYTDKKLELLFEAADRIKAALPAFVLLILGDGSGSTLVRERAEIRPWVHWDGAQRGVPKAVAFGLSNLMLNPGSMGLHILDAFAMGLPMITTRTAQHGPEVAYLVDGVNGLMLEEDGAAFAGAVITLLSDNAKLGAMRAAALASAQRYTIEAMAANFIAGLEAACAN